MGEETEKRGKVYNIIDSVKGGSGKTGSGRKSHRSVSERLRDGRQDTAPQRGQSGALTRG